MSDIKYILSNKQKAIIQNTLYELIIESKAHWNDDNEPGEEPIHDDARSYLDTHLLNMTDSPIDNYFPKLKINDLAPNHWDIHKAINSYIDDTIFALWAHYDAEQPLNKVTHDPKNK